MATPIIITQDVRAAGHEVAKYARIHRLSIHDMQRLLKAAHDGTIEPVGHDPKRQFHIPMGFILVYSIEQHPCGWCHHVSMSSAAKGRAPVPLAVDLALEAMGLSIRVKDAIHSWFEDLSGGEKAINLMFPFHE